MDWRIINAQIITELSKYDNVPTHHDFRPYIISNTLIHPPKKNSYNN